MTNRWGNNGTVTCFIFGVPKSLQMVTAATKLKDTCSLEERLWPAWTACWKQRHYFTSKGLSNQGYGFSSGHVWMWELDYKESWTLNHWCFWPVVLEKTFEHPLDCKKIKPVNSKWNQSWMFLGRTDGEAETLILWPPDAESWLTGKIEGRRRRRWDGWMASPT